MVIFLCFSPKKKKKRWTLINNLNSLNILFEKDHKLQVKKKKKLQFTKQNG